MRRFILPVGALAALGLVAAFAAVRTNPSQRATVTTTAPAAQATVATAPVSARPLMKTAVVNASRPVSVAAKKSTATSGSQGLVVAIDPETGELGMPSPAQIEELNRQVVPEDLEPIKVVNLTGGGVAAELHGQYTDYATIHVAADGTKILGHSDRPTPDAVIPSAPNALEEE